MNAKQLLASAGNVPDALLVAEHEGVDPVEVSLAQSDLETSLRVIRAYPWHTICKQVIEERIAFFTKRRDELLMQYPSLHPYAVRRSFYENQITPLVIELHELAAFLKLKPNFCGGNWQPDDVVDLKRLGTKEFTHLFLRCFYPQRH